MCICSSRQLGSSAEAKLLELIPLPNPSGADRKRGHRRFLWVPNGHMCSTDWWVVFKWKKKGVACIFLGLRKMTCGGQDIFSTASIILSAGWWVKPSGFTALLCIPLLNKPELCEAQFGIKSGWFVAASFGLCSKNYAFFCFTEYDFPCPAAN